MHGMPLTLQRTGRPMWLIACMTAAAICCAALAMSIGEETWVKWFAHPGQPRVELTRQGAALWRIMLVVTALVLVVAPFVWARTALNGSFVPDSQARSR
jgi:hypothetical protein